MIKEIELNDTIIEYDLQYKDVKNINLRITPNGTISVSANKRVALKDIEDFMISKASVIISALEKYEKRRQSERKQYYTEEDVKKLILELCKKFYPYYRKLGIDYPEIKFKKMVSCWGHCNTQKKALTFSTNLMYAPAECIEYVVWHEFTHFLQPNHSRKFYDELTKVCPKWKDSRKKLKEINIR